MRSISHLLFLVIAITLSWSCSNSNNSISGPGIEYRLGSADFSDSAMVTVCSSVIAKRLEQLRISHEDFDVKADSGMLIVRVRKSAVKDEELLEHVLLDRGELSLCETYHFEELKTSLKRMDSVYCRANGIAHDSILGVPVNTPVQQFLQTGFQDSSVYLNGEYIGARFPILYYCKVKDTVAAGKIFNHDSIRALFPSNLQWTWAYDVSEGYKGERVGVVAVKTSKASCLQVEGVASTNYYSAEQGFAFVDIAFDDVTKNDVSRFVKSNAGRSIAIVVDGFVYSHFFAEELRPVVAVTIRETNVSTGHRLAAVLAGGSLPTQLIIKSKATF